MYSRYLKVAFSLDFASELGREQAMGKMEDLLKDILGF